MKNAWRKYSLSWLEKALSLENMFASSCHVNISTLKVEENGHGDNDCIKPFSKVLIAKMNDFY